MKPFSSGSDILSGFLIAGQQASVHARGATAADEPGHVLGCAPPSTERIKVDQVSHLRHRRGAGANIFQGLDKNNIIDQGSSKKMFYF